MLTTITAVLLVGGAADAAVGQKSISVQAVAVTFFGVIGAAAALGVGRHRLRMGYASCVERGPAWIQRSSLNRCAACARGDDRAGDGRSPRAAIDRAAALACAAGRIARRADIDARLAAWTRDRSPRALTAILQAAGVPAGFMQRPTELEHDPHLEARDVFRTFNMPDGSPRTIEDAPFRAERIPRPRDAAAPEPGEHTREVCVELLGMTPDDVGRLLASGVLEEPAAAGHVAVPR
jgi:crotonobetainyl-CoA:carnitine CoA-transferase CaiB-like acyl-CoA transferase